MLLQLHVPLCGAEALGLLVLQPSERQTPRPKLSAPMMREMASPSKRDALPAELPVRQPPKDGWPTLSCKRRSFLGLNWRSRRI